MQIRMPVAPSIEVSSSGLEIAAFAAALVCAVPAFKNILTARNGSRAANILLNAWLMVLFLLSSAAMAASTYNPFIYFRF